MVTGNLEDRTQDHLGASVGEGWGACLGRAQSARVEDREEARMGRERAARMEGGEGRRLEESQQANLEGSASAREFNL